MSASFRGIHSPSPVTSFTELRRTGLEIERRNRISPTEPPQPSGVEKRLGPTAEPVIAATDYVRAVPDLANLGPAVIRHAGNGRLRPQRHAPGPAQVL